MDNWQLITIISVSLVLLVFLLFRMSKKKPKQNPKHIHGHKAAEPSHAHGRYYSVSIKPGPKACDAVLALRGKCYLASEAPLFPLPDCNSPLCECVYEHHEDRRDRHHDRRNPSISMSESEDIAGEKRTGQERRNTDHAA